MDQLHDYGAQVGASGGRGIFQGAGVVGDDIVATFFRRGENVDRVKIDGGNTADLVEEDEADGDADGAKDPGR